MTDCVGKLSLSYMKFFADEGVVIYKIYSYEYTTNAISHATPFLSF